ncbi:MAG TPA: CorA family divalent cation transporter [Beijerinckiaceae bacterium]|jgi:Mg2+ and Co2+ transporter CorA|nr:CorA family divalent cation transporter [Beijerinckiaceae bacterium]
MHDKISTPDREAVVFAYRFDESGRASALTGCTTAELSSSARGFIWVHLNLADVRARQFLSDLEDVPAAALQAMLRSSDHQQMHHEAGVLWGVFPDLAQDFDGVRDDFAHLRFLLSDRWLVSGRHHAAHAIETLRRTIEAGASVDAPVTLFETLADHIADGLDGAVTRMADELDECEDRILADDSSKEARALGLLRRQGVRIERKLAGVHSILRRLEGARPESLSPAVHAAVIRVSHRFETLHHESHALVERTRLLQDEVSNQLQSSANAHLYVLTILNSVLAPAVLVTGFFGMNTADLPFKDTPGGTWYGLGLCVLAAGLTVWFMRRRGAIGSQKR